MDAGSVSFLVAGLFHVWVHGGKLSQCLHLSNAARTEHRFSRLTLPALPICHPVVPERPPAYLAILARQMRQLQSAHFHPLLFGRAADRPAFSWALVGLRASIAWPCPCLLYFDWRLDCGNVHRLRAFH